MAMACEVYVVTTRWAVVAQVPHPVMAPALTHGIGFSCGLVEDGPEALGIEVLRRLRQSAEAAEPVPRRWWRRPDPSTGDAEQVLDLCTSLGLKTHAALVRKSTALSVTCDDDRMTVMRLEPYKSGGWVDSEAVVSPEDTSPGGVGRAVLDLVRRPSEDPA